MHSRVDSEQNTRRSYVHVSAWVMMLRKLYITVSVEHLTSSPLE